MDQETEALVRAIESLRNEPSLFKDYLFPIASAFFTSLLGAGVAYYTLRHQEGIQIEKQKMDAANKWLLLVESARSTLLAIKSNYHGELTADPVQRVGIVPNILIHADPIVERYDELSFIIPRSD